MQTSGSASRGGDDRGQRAAELEVWTSGSSWGGGDVRRQRQRWRCGRLAAVAMWVLAETGRGMRMDAGWMDGIQTRVGLLDWPELLCWASLSN